MVVFTELVSTVNVYLIFLKTFRSPISHEFKQKNFSTHFTFIKMTQI